MGSNSVQVAHWTISRWVIFGAGGLGREVLAYIRRKGNQALEVFVDPAMEGELVAGALVVPEDAVIHGRIRGVIAVGNPKLRKSIADGINRVDIHFEPLLFGYMGAWVQADDGVVVCPGAILTTNITLEKHVYINIGCTIGHDVRIGAYSMLNPNCNISGSVEMGQCCLIGSGATILQGLTLGHHVTVGAGAIVTRDVPDGMTVVGVPAKPVRKRAEEHEL